MSEPRPAAGRAPLRFLTFRVEAAHYALPAEEVAEVVRLPALARLPQAPAGLLGIGNLRGTALPVASARALLGQSEAPAPLATARAIVLRGQSPVALAVDAVGELVAIDPDRLEEAQASALVRPGEAFTGAFRFHGERDVARILDILPLLATAFAPRARPARPPAAGPASAPAATAMAASAGKLISFEADGQEYALPIEQVREVVPLPDAVTTLPLGEARASATEAVARGVMVYRDRLLPLFALRALLALPPAPATRTAKVVVVKRGALWLGLVVDRITAVLPLDPARVEPIPPALAARVGGEARLKAIFRAGDGSRLVSILDAHTLFREEVMQRLDTHDATEAATAASEGEDEASFLVFRLGGDEYGLPIAAVDEVMKVPDTLTRVPKTPAFLEGVINLRGAVLPVIDQRRRFDMPPLAEATRRRLIVLRSAHHRAGILVDSVSEILRRPQDAIAPAPDLAGEPTRLVSGILNLDQAGRIILLLDPDELLTRTERGLLDAFAKAGAKTATRPAGKAGPAKA